MNKTGIGWTDFTHNPVTGCEHGCNYCYARELAEGRLKHIYKKGFEPTFWKERLEQPLKRKKPTRIFVGSMADMFGNWVPNNWIEKVLDIARKAPQHTFQFLTKNPKRYNQFDIPKNCWLGTTITGTEGIRGTSKIVKLHPHYGGQPHNPNNIRFVSLEPLLGPHVKDVFDSGWIDWVIIGALTGKNAKQPDTNLVKEIITESKRKNMSVFVKENLEWTDKLRLEFGDKPKEFPDD